MTTQLPTRPHHNYTGTHLFLAFMAGLFTASIAIGLVFLLQYEAEPQPIVLHPPPTSAPTATPVPTSTPAPFVIFVSGAIMQPGVYELAPDVRVGDAILAAGGLAENANATIVNQAEMLWDGAQVHIPEMPVTDAPEAQPDQSTLLSQPASAQAAPPAGVSGAPAADSGQPLGQGSGSAININTASVTELETLPGIGPSKAQAIVDNRPYATVDELERVPGIGAKTVEQLRELVRTQ